MPKMSNPLLAIGLYSILALTPAGSLIAGASTGLPCGHIVAGTEGRDTGDPAELLDFSLDPALDDAGDRAVALDQEQGRDAGDAEGIAGGKSFSSRSSRVGKVTPKCSVELAGVLVVILRDAVDGERAGGVQAFEEGKGHLADGAGDFEEGEEDGAVGDQVVEGGFAAVEAGRRKSGARGAGLRGVGARGGKP